MLLRRRPDGERGAAAVEFALLFPIFMMLALGIFAAGGAYSKQMNVTQAAREASRFGATLDVAAAVPVSTETQVQAWLRTVDTALMQAAGSATDPFGGYDERCVAYVVTTASGSVDATRSKHRRNGTNGDNQCPNVPASAVSAIPSTDYVQVTLIRNTDFFLLTFTADLTLDSVSLTPYEGKAP